MIIPQPHHIKALAIAEQLMSDLPELEPTSALKEAGSIVGIEFGPDMQEFVEWARVQWFGEQHLTEKFEAMEAQEFPPS